MADHEPSELSFPERIRVHALAKLLGVTSKQVLTQLSDMGSAARSVQSSVVREDAESVARALSGAAQASEAPAAELIVAAEPVVVAEPIVLAEPPAVATESDSVPKPLPTSEADTAAEPDLFTHAAAPEVTDRPVSQPADVPLFLQPEAPAAPARRRRRATSAAGSPAAAPETPAVDKPIAEPAADETTTHQRKTAMSTADSGTSETSTSGDTDAPAQKPARRRSARKSAATRASEAAAAEELAAVASEPDSEPAADVANEATAADSTDTTDTDSTDTDTDNPETSDSDNTDSSDDDSSGPRRRRRGRRGRGRGRGEQGSDADGSDDGDDSTAQDGRNQDKSTDQTPSDENAADENAADENASESEDDSDQDDSGQGEQNDADGDSGSRRRRRRRRRKSGGESGSDGDTTEDDPPNTVVHEREPRNKQRSSGSSNRDEVQGITGSTRLEAKRQRRRDGRDAGRRRPPILSESEFLARREAVDRTMVVREKSLPGHPDLTQVAVLEDGVLVEHFVTSTSSGSIAGNVYLGRVQNVLPSMEAAFIDIGKGRNGVLYAGEVDWEAAGLGGNSRKIEQALKPGDQVLVQVSKDPVGHKGARLTTQISLAGRFLVYVPGGSSTGISRKLPDTERKRLKDILRDVVPADAGVIIRTASEGVSAEELGHDVTRLQAQWAMISEASSKAESSKGSQPQSLYEEPDLLVKVVRDLFNEDFSKLVIEGDRAWSTVENYIQTVAPDMLPRVERYGGESKDVDVFAAYRIDEQLAKALDRKVWLPSGGTLVIDRTEAMTVVDVNTGKFTGEGGNLEETVTRNNLEAAEEVVRQMRLRDIGGMIVVDFIDMVLESNRDLVLRRLTEALGRDRTRHQVSEVTSLGLVQMTRKRMGTGLVEAFSTTCDHCHGRGILIHQFPVELKSDDGGRGGSNRSENRSDSGSGSATSGSSRRRRGGKDRSEQKPDAAEATTDETSEEPVDASIKRAHPVALAMAAHMHPDDENAGTIEVVVRNSDDEVVASEVIDSAGDRSGTVELEQAPTQAAVESGAPVAEAGKADESAVEATKADEPAVAAATRPRRGRRVSRAASAPQNGEVPSGTVIVVPVGESPAAPAEPVVTTVAGGASVVPVAETTRPKRRRAAGRPAGPPVEEA